jgi:sugar O-acyltransferase (sialic acid O-acetyltransferase NeuD family)
MASLIIAGAGSWAQGLAILARGCLGSSVTAYAVDREHRDRDSVDGVPLREIDEVMNSEPPSSCAWLIGIVDYRHRMQGRARVIERLEAKGHKIIGLAHPTACTEGAVIDPTATVLSGAIVGPGSRLGSMSVIAQGAVVSHHCVIGACCYIGPGASVSGNVTIGAQTFIGVGAVVRDGVSIGSRCLIGAGAVVLADVPDGTVVVDRHESTRRRDTSAENRA